MSGDFDFEPIRGLPAHLPKGETLLWQGAPEVGATALQVFHARKVAIYFGLLLAWRLIGAAYDGTPLWPTVVGSLPLVGLGFAAVVILMVMAYLVCRTTVYSITSRRVVMRIGVALPITFNIPFSAIRSASLKSLRNGTGTIPLALTDANKLAYFVIWPHARPWKMARAEPALRLVPDSAKVAQILSQAVAAAAPEAFQQGAAPITYAQPSNDPSSWPLAPAAI